MKQTWKHPSPFVSCHGWNDIISSVVAFLVSQQAHLWPARLAALSQPFAVQCARPQQLACAWTKISGLTHLWCIQFQSSPQPSLAIPPWAHLSTSCWESNRSNLHMGQPAKGTCNKTTGETVRSHRPKQLDLTSILLLSSCCQDSLV